MNSMAEKSAVIRMFHVYKRYGAKQALVDVSLDIAKNEFLYISGPSGAGKSTLLKLLYLAEPVSEGQILVDGMNLSRIPRGRILFQDYKLIPTRTIFENVALVLETQRKKRSLIEKKVKGVLRVVGMEDRLKALPPSLSGGEQQRVAVARAVAGDPKIILADEPTGSLDDDSAAIIFKLLNMFHHRGATVVVATHDKSLIQNTSGRVLQIRQGRLDTPPDI
jgi:cell division transport system ATP-binding protein